MSKLIFAVVVLVVGLALHGALRRQTDRLPIFRIARGVPALIRVFSILRITPAGQIQQRYVARWERRLPQYSIGGGVVPLLPLPGGAAAPEAARR